MQPKLVFLVLAGQELDCQIPHQDADLAVSHMHLLDTRRSKVCPFVHMNQAAWLVMLLLTLDASSD